MESNNFSIIGKKTIRFGDKQKAVGKTVYVHDMMLPNMLYGKILRSTMPHARILNIDTTKAERLFGVKAVITAKSIPLVNFGPWMQDQTLLPIDKVRYIGQEVAAVAAEDRDTAEEACELIEVDYEELTPVFDPVEAMKPEAPLVDENLAKYESLHPSVACGNMASHSIFQKGDVEKAFEDADTVVEETFSTQTQHQMYLERRVALASYDIFLERLTVWTSTQTPFMTAGHLGQVLRMPISKIRVITPPIGGGFGGKANPLFEGHTAFLSLKTGRPVKIELASEEDFMCTNPRHASVSKIKFGAKKDGTITAFQFEFYLDNGAQVFEGPAVCDLGTIFGRGPYWFENYKIDGYSVLTNKIIAGAFRGFGNPQVSWARESTLDILAEKLSMDPLELRKKNTIKTGQPMVTGQIVENSGIDKCIRHCEETHGIGHQLNGENQGRGCAFLMHPTGLLSSAAFVKIHEDGSIVVLNGAVEIGGGQSTLLAMIAAEELGVSLEKVAVVLSDTDVTPYEWQTVASRTTYNSANAVKRAAADAKQQLLKIAAEILGSDIDPEELKIRDGLIYRKSDPEKKISVHEVSFSAHYIKGGPILGRGSFFRDEPPRDPKIMSGVSTAIWPESTEGIQIIDVEVDVETGLVKPLHIGFANDCGRAINPLTIEGQMQGGAVQGLGFSLMEQYIFDNGKMVNPSLLDYAIPTAMDVPTIKATWIENPSPTGPFGARGIGEPALVPTAPAIANAIYKAVGVRINDLPMTPDKIIKAIKAKKKRKK